MISLPTRRFLGLCALLMLISTTLYATPVLTVEMPAGSNLIAGATVDFGGMQSRFVDPVSKTHAPDGTFTVTFTGIPRSSFSSYHIQRSSNGQFGWAELFAPGLEPNSAGFLTFHDPTPLVNAFYRLQIITDTQRTFTIRNTGTSDLTDIAVSLDGPDSPSFQLDTGIMGTTLAPGASTTFSVTYIAGDTDIRTAELRIADSLTGAFVLALRGGDLPPPTPQPSLATVTLVRASQVAPATIAGTIKDGPANGSVVLEASTDLGRLDAWETIATIPLDANGRATFGVPTPIADPNSVGAPRNFYRLRVN